jgi:hypothetical protein
MGASAASLKMAVKLQLPLFQGVLRGAFFIFQ